MFVDAYVGVGTSGNKLALCVCLWNLHVLVSVFLAFLVSRSGIHTDRHDQVDSAIDPDHECTFFILYYILYYILLGTTNLCAIAYQHSIDLKYFYICTC